MEIFYWWQQMLAAVNAVHDHHIVHCDLKPQNFILFRQRGREFGAGASVRFEHEKYILKLSDFGVSRQLEDSCTHVSEEAPVGTVRYMAPEVLHDSRRSDGYVEVGQAADQWSIGVVLHLMLHQGLTPHSHVERRNHRLRLMLAIANEKSARVKSSCPRLLRASSQSVCCGEQDEESAARLASARHAILISLQSKCLQFIPKERATTEQLLAVTEKNSPLFFNPNEHSTRKLLEEDGGPNDIFQSLPGSCKSSVPDSDEQSGALVVSPSRSDESGALILTPSRSEEDVSTIDRAADAVNGASAEDHDRSRATTTPIEAAPASAHFCQCKIFGTLIITISVAAAGFFGVGGFDAGVAPFPHVSSSPKPSSRPPASKKPAGGPAPPSLLETMWSSSSSPPPPPPVVCGRTSTIAPSEPTSFPQGAPTKNVALEGDVFIVGDHEEIALEGTSTSSAAGVLLDLVETPAEELVRQGELVRQETTPSTCPPAGGRRRRTRTTRLPSG